MPEGIVSPRACKGDIAAQPFTGNAIISRGTAVTDITMIA
ncbi:Uncharacterised protein [Vibrio cholerae]|nr:Uncharacterised protein [Vibrio cholerae]CSI52301.1 Uncharacterised protein [Vibrio cholerae]